MAWLYNSFISSGVKGKPILLTDYVYVHTDI